MSIFRLSLQSLRYGLSVLTVISASWVTMARADTDPNDYVTVPYRNPIHTYSPPIQTPAQNQAPSQNFARPHRKLARHFVAPHRAAVKVITQDNIAPPLRLQPLPIFPQIPCHPPESHWLDRCSPSVATPEDNGFYFDESGFFTEQVAPARQRHWHHSQPYHTQRHDHVRQHGSTRWAVVMHPNHQPVLQLHGVIPVYERTANPPLHIDYGKAKPVAVMPSTSEPNPPAVSYQPIGRQAREMADHPDAPADRQAGFFSRGEIGRMSGPRTSERQTSFNERSSRSFFSSYSGQVTARFAGYTPNGPRDDRQAARENSMGGFRAGSGEMGGRAEGHGWGGKNDVGGRSDNRGSAGSGPAGHVGGPSCPGGNHQGGGDNHGHGPNGVR